MQQLRSDGREGQVGKHGDANPEDVLPKPSQGRHAGLAA